VNIPHDPAGGLLVDGKKAESPIVVSVDNASIFVTVSDTQYTTIECPPEKRTSVVKLETAVPGLKLTFVRVFHSTIN
jgi:hypothetical protein